MEFHLRYVRRVLKNKDCLLSALAMSNFYASEIPTKEDFEVIDNACKILKIRCNFRPRPEKTSQRKIKKAVDTNDTRAIKLLYRRNRKKALRTIYGEEGGFCVLDHEEVAAHFSTQGPPVPSDVSHLSAIPSASIPICLSPFHWAEVSSKLKNLDSSATGPDGITYNHPKTAD